MRAAAHESRNIWRLMRAAVHESHSIWRLMKAAFMTAQNKLHEIRASVLGGLKE